MLDITLAEIDDNTYKLVHWYAALIAEIDLYRGMVVEEGSDLSLYRKVEPDIKEFLEQKGLRIKNNILFYKDKKYTLDSSRVSAAKKVMPAIIRDQLPRIFYKAP